MKHFKLNDTVDKNKVFLVNLSEIEGRLDPIMILYQRKTEKYKYDTLKIKDLIITSPQYGANEAGIDRSNNESPRYIRITDIDDNGHLIDELGKTAKIIESQYYLENNDILIARSGNTVGKSYIHKVDKINYPCFFAGYMIRFKINAKIAEPDYIFITTQLHFYKEWLNAVKRVAGQPNINAEEYKNFKIPVPPKPTQQQIINLYETAYTQKQQKEAEAKAILNSIDDYLLNELGITLPQKDNALKNRIFTTQFSQISGGRFDPYFQQSDFVDFFERLNKISYPILRIKQLSSKITSGITPLSGSDAYVDPNFGVPFIRSGNININGDINFDNLLYIKNDIHKNKMRSSQVEYNDIMVAIVGATIGQVGVYKYKRDANINQAIALIRLKSGYNVDYIKEIIKSSIGQYSLNRLKRPVARANINLEEIATMKVVVPPIAKQNEIAEHITKLRRQAKQLEVEAQAVLDQAKQKVEQMILGE